MKKTLLIIAAALSTSLVFGQSVVAEKNTAPAKISTLKVQDANYGVSSKAFAAPKGTNTKDAGDALVDWTFSEDFFLDSLCFGRANQYGFGANDYQGYWFYANGFTLEDFTNAQTKKNVCSSAPADLEKVNKSVTFNWAAPLQDLFKDVTGILAISSWERDNGAGGEQMYDSWVRFPTFHVKDRPAVIEFYEYVYKIGNDNYFITYSTNFGASDEKWDTIIYNALTHSLDIGTQFTEITRLVLPSEVTNTDVTIRMHMLGKQCLTFIPHVKIYEAKDYDMNILYHEYIDNAYHRIPLGLKPRDVYWMAAVRNMGAENLSNIQGIITIENSQGAEIARSTSERIETLEPTRDTSFAAFHGSRYEAGGAVLTPFPADAEGTYTVRQKIVYNTDSTITLAQNPVYYTVSDPDKASDSLGVWSRDNGVTKANYGWTVAYEAGGTFNPQYNVAEKGYGVFVGYNTDSVTAPTKDLYIVGVQMVLTAETRPNVAVSPRIYTIDNITADNTINFHITNGKQIQVVPAASIPNFTGDDPYFEDDGYPVFMLTLDTAIKIEAGKAFYGGYVMEEDSYLSVSRNYFYTLQNADDIAFRAGNGERGSVLFISPKYEERYNSFYPYATDVPMIRLLVTTDPTNIPGPVVGINSPKSADFNLNVYPNPAINYVNIGYKLEKSAKATIEIYDIFGRLVKLVDTQAIAGEYKKETINVSDLAAGAYISIINVDGLRQSKKFIVTK